MIKNINIKKDVKLIVCNSKKSKKYYVSIAKMSNNLRKLVINVNKSLESIHVSSVNCIKTMPRKLMIFFIVMLVKCVEEGHHKQSPIAINVGTVYLMLADINA